MPYLNRLCQKERLLSHQLSKICVHIDRETYHVGDRVMFLKAKRRHGIENGHQATIKSIHPITKAVTFKLDREPNMSQRMFGVSQVVTLKKSELRRDFLGLGYAATTHKMQGQSRDRAYCLIGGALTNRELMYVQITRGSEMTKLFTDRHHAGQKLSDLADAIEKSGKQDLAHDRGLRLRLKRDERGES